MSTFWIVVGLMALNVILAAINKNGAAAVGWSTAALFAAQIAIKGCS